MTRSWSIKSNFCLLDGQDGLFCLFLQSCFKVNSNSQNPSFPRFASLPGRRMPDVRGHSLIYIQLHLLLVDTVGYIHIQFTSLQIKYKLLLSSLLFRKHKYVMYVYFKLRQPTYLLPFNMIQASEGGSPLHFPALFPCLNPATDCKFQAYMNCAKIYYFFKC